MNWLGEFYQRFWYATEFWLTPVNRRPYTFIMRDWLFRHTTSFIVILVVWVAGMFSWNLYHPVPAYIVSSLGWFLLAHLIWGTKWIEHQ